MPLEVREQTGQSADAGVADNRPMTSSMNRKIWIILLIMALFGRNPAFAQNARLSDITITNTHYGLELVYLNIKGTFTEKMKKAVMSGVLITFSFFINVDEVRRFWSDRRIVELEITHTVKYDNLRKQFIITRSWKNDNPAIVKSFTEARKLMSEITHLPILPSEKLKKGGHYQFKAKAELSKVTLPLYLHYILILLSLWDFETEWQAIDFVY